MLDDDTTTFLTIKEAAALFRVSRKTIYRWVATDRLRAERSPSGRCLFHREDLEAVLGRREPEDAA